MGEEKVIEAARPERYRRIYVYWGIALALLISAALFCWLVVLPVGQVRRALEKALAAGRSSQIIGGKTTIVTSISAGAMSRVLVTELGGTEKAVARLTLYLRMPDRFAPHKEHAVSALGEFRRPGALGVLVKMLGDEDAEIRGAAALAIAKLKGDAAPAVPALVHALDDKDKWVRWGAAGALANIGPAAKEAAPKLAELLNDPDLHVRLYAAAALTQVGEKERGIQALEKLLKAKGDGVRMLAARALFTLGRRREEAVGIIAECLSPGKGFNTRQSAATVLADFGPDAKAAIPALTRALGDEEEEIRGHAARALGEIGPAATGAIPELEKLLNSEEEQVRAAAREALNKIRAVRNIDK